MFALHMNWCSNQLTKGDPVYRHWGFFLVPSTNVYSVNSSCFQSNLFLFISRKEGETGTKNGRKQDNWEEVEENKGLKAVFQATEISRVK